MSSPGSLLDDHFDWFPRTGSHRYFLEQTFGRHGPSDRPLVIVALNPAANTPAGYRRSDTCRKAKLWAAPRGFDGIIYLNLFTALEVLSTALHRADLVVDDAADEWFVTAAERSSEPVIAAWGSRPGKIPRALHAQRVAHVRKLLEPRPLICLGLTATGDPLHPRGWKKSAEPLPFEPDPTTGRMAPPSKARPELLVRLDVDGDPGSMATAHEATWNALVRDAAAHTGVGPRHDHRFSIRFEFRIPQATHTSEVSNLDTLITLTLEAMEEVLGLRHDRRHPELGDDRIDHIDAMKCLQAKSRASRLKCGRRRPSTTSDRYLDRRLGQAPDGKRCLGSTEHFVRSCDRIPSSSELGLPTGDRLRPPERYTGSPSRGRCSWRDLRTREPSVTQLEGKLFGRTAHP